MPDWGQACLEAANGNCREHEVFSFPLVHVDDSSRGHNSMKFVKFDSSQGLSQTCFHACLAHLSIDFQSAS